MKKRHVQVKRFTNETGILVRLNIDGTGKSLVKTGVRLQNLKTKKQTIVDCAGVFVAIGHIPNTQFFNGIIDMDDAGYIIPKRGMETNVPGVFVAGDCSDRVYRQAVTAAGMGCAAAIDAERYLAKLNQ